ncbi:MAG: hypothetical protein IPM94_08115 [bacterium]|nr:hypothetical protein [bacterium]
MRRFTSTGFYDRQYYINVPPYTNIANIGLCHDGDIILIGDTNSPSFPVTAGAYDTVYNGGPVNYNNDGFVMKFDTGSGNILWSTFIGGGNNVDEPLSVCVDSSDNVIITGWTGSSDYPITDGAVDPSIGFRSTMVSKLSADGSELLWSTFMDGAGSSYGEQVLCDSRDNAVIVGWTASEDMPITNNAYDTTYNDQNDAYIAKISANGRALHYCTYLGGSTLQ